MTPEEVQQLRLIIRQEIRSAIEGISLFGPSSFCGGDPDYIQQRAELDAQIRQKEAKAFEKLLAKRAKKAASN